MTPLRSESARWVFIAIAALVAFLAITIAIGTTSIRRLYDAQQQVVHTYEVLNGLERLLSTVKDAEAGQRGFLLTGDALYLEPYERAVAGLAPQLDNLAALFQDNPGQRSRLAGLRSQLAAKGEELAQTIAIRREQGGEAARLLVLTNTGKATMDSARAVVAAMNAEAVQLLAERERTRTEARHAAYGAILGSGFLALGLCLCLAYLLFRHLSLRTRASAEVHAEKELFRTTLASIGDAVITTDTAGRIVFLNAVAEALTGWTSAEAIEQPLDVVFEIINEDTREKVENPALRALRDGTMAGLANHTTLISRAGDETPIDDSAAPIRDASGALVGAVLVFRDISERKRVEDESREGERRKDEFLATLAHELRNPLAPLRNALHIARKASSEAGGRIGTGAMPMGEMLAMMERQVEQMVRLVDDLLDVARITRGRLELRMEIVDLSTVVRHALETCAPLLAQGNHAVTVVLPQQPLHVDGDAIRLAQVICNLLNNAAKYSDPGSGIDLRVERKGADAVVTVGDAGMGIPAAMLDRIFDMFSQVDHSLERSQSGLGIGLTLARQIVEMHGGAVFATSEGPGRGSVFVVHLPASRTTPPPLTAAPTGPEPASPRKLKVLIADDNQDSADSMAMVLRAQGHSVEVAYDGEQAMARANESRPDVLLLDIGMPKMNGYDVARAIRAQAWASRTVLIALTGWGQDDDKQRSEAAGFDRHLTKPIEPDRLEATLHTLRDSRAP